MTDTGLFPARRLIPVQSTRNNKHFMPANEAARVQPCFSPLLSPGPARWWWWDPAPWQKI